MGLIKNAGEAISGIFNSITSEANDQFNLIRLAYDETETSKTNAVIEGGGGTAETAPGVYSIFNPFNVFRYSRFGMGLNGGSYNKKLHYDSLDNMDLKQIALKDVDLKGDISQNLRDFKEADNIKKINIENPTASRIIQWANAQGRDAINGENQVVTPVPYTAEDFIWCKYYGKIPNNRMVTLRRYPFPVSDDIRINSEVSPPIPLAQAVTWYGKDIGNDLNSILNLKWALNWTSLTTDMSDVEGNEITIEAALKILKIDSNSNQAKLAKVLLGSEVNLAELSGFDKIAQDYIRDSYGLNGPYWNRILGPVNVINQTYIRDRGFKEQDPIILNFDYSLRSYGGINPKIAFLDLLSNFLSLTYNTASFWGGGLRYFEKTGPKLDLYGMEEDMLNGNTDEAIKHGLQALTNLMSQNLDKVKDAINQVESALGSGLNNKSVEEIAQMDQVKQAGRALQIERQGWTGSDAANNEDAGLLSQFSVQFMKEFIRKPLIMRSVLDGREIGEWHMVIGNPMNPMAMMGNLICDSVDMTVGESLGIDDFPTEFSFKVTLKHGRPRAKQDIESIFNLGKGAMSFSGVRAPSSAYNSYGEYAKILADTFTNTNPESKAKSELDANSSTEDNSNTPVVNTAMADAYGKRINKLYGSGFASSNILESYFTYVKTKD